MLNSPNWGQKKRNLHPEGSGDKEIYGKGLKKRKQKTKTCLSSVGM